MNLKQKVVLIIFLKRGFNPPVVVTVTVVTVVTVIFWQGGLAAKLKPSFSILSFN